MSIKVADRVLETSATTGTGNVTLDGAIVGHRSFNGAFSSGDVVYYCIEDGANWEVGEGTFTSTSTLARTTVLASSNGGSLVDFPAGTKRVFNTVPASAINPPAPEVSPISGTSHNLAASDAQTYMRFTNASAKTLTVRLNATEALKKDSEYHGRNVGTSNLTIAAVSGVTINVPAGGSLVVPQGGTFTLKRVLSDEFDLFGLVSP